MGGWNWKVGSFKQGVFRIEDGEYRFCKLFRPLGKGVKENNKSLVVQGDYVLDYLKILNADLMKNYSAPTTRNTVHIDLDYEPIIALLKLLEDPERDLIGGKPQMLKLYRYARDSPLAYMDASGVFLFGRKLMEWEKTTYPICFRFDDEINTNGWRC